jgi:hypothetical protein
MAAREAAKPKLSGRVEVDDTYLGGERTGGKRGRGAAGKTPVIAAVETTAERKPRRLRLTVVKGFRKKEVEKVAKRDLAPGTDVISDGLSCWPAVEKAGCAHFPHGDRFRQAGGGLGAVQVGQHHPRQHQDRDRRHVPSRQPEARAVVPRELRVPVQPPSSARQHRRAPRLGRRPHRPQPYRVVTADA